MADHPGEESERAGMLRIVGVCRQDGDRTAIDAAGTRLVGLGVDVIWIGDDFGMQDRMLIAPADAAAVDELRCGEEATRNSQTNTQLTKEKYGRHHARRLLTYKWFEAGVNWMKSHAPEDQDLILIRRQAEDLLGLTL